MTIDPDIWLTVGAFGVVVVGILLATWEAPETDTTESGLPLRCMQPYVPEVVLVKDPDDVWSTYAPVQAWREDAKARACIPEVDEMWTYFDPYRSQRIMPTTIPGVWINYEAAT